MVVLKITSSGFNVALDAQNNGLTLRLAKVKFGSGKYAVIDNDPRTALENPFVEADFVGGGVEPESHTLRFNCSFKDTQTREVNEIGLYTAEDVLFAVTSSQDEPFFSTSKTLASVFIGGLKLGAFDSSAVEVVLDENGAMALQIFGAHEAHSNPHPQYAKKAQNDQDHNYFTNIINDLKTRITNMENKVVEEIGIGDFFLTNNNFANGQEVTAHKKYGKWIRFGEGKALVGLSTKESDPEWTKQIGNVFGEYNHTLSIPELPKHHMTFKSQWAGLNPPDVETVVWQGDIGWEKDNSWDSSIIQKSDEIGADQPHNNVQPSVVVAAWQRIPENIILSASQNSVNEGQSIVFTLETQEDEVGTAYAFIITGVQSNDILPGNLTGQFVIGSDGKATYQLTVVDDLATELTEVLKLSLVNFPSIFCEVEINDTSMTNVITIDKNWNNTATQVEGYYLKPTVILYDAFVSKLGRAPAANEAVTFIVESDVAIVGNNTLTAALISDERWLNNAITIQNHGLILGKGGNPSWNDQNYSVNPPSGPVYDATNGGTAIQSTYVNELTIQNYGLIAGGGGGGGAAGTSQDKALIAGGAGAPLGTLRLNKIFQENNSPIQATLQSGGIGGKLRIFGSNWWLGGDGGAVGEDGSNGNTGGESWLSGGQAGLVSSGNVVINNIASGQTKGR